MYSVKDWFDAWEVKGVGGAYKLQYRYSPWEGSSIAWYTIRSALYIHVEGYIIVYLPNILDIASPDLNNSLGHTG